MSIISSIVKYKDVFTFTFSIVSLILASTSLFFSIRNILKDKEKLVIKAWNVSTSVNDKVYKIEVTVTNVGRRIAVIEGLLFHYENGFQYYEPNKDGVILKEKERITLSVEQRNMIYDVGEGEVYQLEDVSVLDIEGREFKINNSKMLVSKLLKDF